MCPDKQIITKIRKGNNSVIIFDRAMVLALTLSLIALYQCIRSFVVFFLYGLLKRYATDKLIIAKIKTRSNSVITCNRVTVLALCTISDGHPLMYQVSFDSLLYFQRYASDKFDIAKIRKGNNSINTENRVMVLAFCILPRGPLSLYQVSFIYLQYF